MQKDVNFNQNKILFITIFLRVFFQIKESDVKKILPSVEIYRCHAPLSLYQHHMNENRHKDVPIQNDFSKFLIRGYASSALLENSIELQLSTADSFGGGISGFALPALAPIQLVLIWPFYQHATFCACFTICRLWRKHGCHGILV